MKTHLSFTFCLCCGFLTQSWPADAFDKEGSTRPAAFAPMLIPANEEALKLSITADGEGSDNSLVVPVDPRLSVMRVQGNVLLFWPEAAADWALEQAPHLQAPVPWIRVSTSLYQTNAGLRFVRVSPAEEGRFYRLRKFGPTVPGLTGHWQLDEGIGQSAADETGSGADLLFTNTAWSGGRIGSAALRFNGGGAGTDGSRAWVSNASYRVLPPTGEPFSLSLWFSPDLLTTGWQGLAGNDRNETNGWHLGLQTLGPGTNDLVFAATGAATSLSLTGRTLLLPGQWHQLTMTHDGREGCLYLDSALLACGTGGLLTHDGPISFGGGVSSYDSFAGRIDDIRTYTNALTPEQVSLTGHWRFDEQAGGVAADSSLQGHHARVTDPAAWGVGHNGSGLDLGVGRVVIRNDEYAVLPVSGGAFSISCWLQPHGLPMGRSELMSCTDGTNNGWQLVVQVEDSGQSHLHFGSTNAGGTLDMWTPLILTDGVWTKLDLTYNGGMASVYVNGRQVQSSIGAIRGSRAPLVMGAVPGASSFNGVIDDLKIYSRERGAAEVGPVALAMWETAWMNTATNLPLQGFGPAGKPLTFSLVPSVVPTNGTVHVSAGSPSATYSAGGRKGPDAFAYVVSDGEFTSVPAMVMVSVVEPHWLSPQGSPDSPLDGRSPDRAWAAGEASALDAIWRTNKFYDCFFYAPGEYQTTGWKYGERPTAQPGCKHVGAGSVGLDATTLKLVDIRETWAEENIFAPAYWTEPCDGFEVHNMILDCNAANLPKFTRGEPVWLRIPLVNTTRVDTVTLRWNQGTIQGNTTWELGRAVEFRLCTQKSATPALMTNCSAFSSTNQVDTLAVGADADELLLELDRRAAGVDFYAIGEIEIAGGTVSLPAATVSGGGESRLDSQHSVLLAVDGDPETWWASGPESQVEIALPLPPGTPVSQINLRWKCQTIPGIGRVGPAAGYLIQARDEATRLYFDVPFVHHGRTTNGWQTNTFGTLQSTNPIRTDQLVIVLTNKEPTVDYFGLRDVNLQNGPSPVAMRLPTAQSSLNWGGDYGMLRAFDGDPGTPWVSGTQGAVGAINVMANNLKFTGLKVIGFGTKAARECFPMYLVAPGYGAPRRLGNVLVEDCVFSAPATNNADGLTTVALAAFSPHQLTNAVVRRCTVSGVKSQFAYSQGISAAHVEDCLVQDCGRAVAFEPDQVWGEDLGPILIRSNRFLNVDSGVYVFSHPSAQLDTIACLANEIVLTGVGGSGVGACDVCLYGPSGSITNVTVLNNVIRYEGWATRPTRADSGLFYSDIHHAVLGNNLIALGTAGALRVRQCPAGLIPVPDPTEDCNQQVFAPRDPPSYPPCVDALRPGYRRAWFNNRDLAGTLLDVRFANQGQDGLASQQQWRE